MSNDTSQNVTLKDKIKRFVLKDIRGSFYQNVQAAVCEYSHMISDENSNIEVAFYAKIDGAECGCVIKNPAMRKIFLQHKEEYRQFVVVYSSGYSSLVHIHFMATPDTNMMNQCKQAAREINWEKDKAAKALSPKFIGLPQSLIPFAEQQLSCSNKYETVKSDYIRFSCPYDMRKFYEATRESFTPTNQAFLDSCFKSHEIVSNKKKAETILSFCTGYKEESATLDRKALDKAISCNDENKNAILKAISVAMKTKKKSIKVLFVGPKATGKRSMIECIAKARKKPIVTIPYYSYTSVVDIAGANPTFQDSMPGDFWQRATAVSSADATYVFQGIDRATHESNKNGTPDQCLEHILSAGVYTDLHEELDLDLHNAWIFATAESFHDVPKKIRSGFDFILHFKPYSNEEKLVIAQKHIVPRITDGKNAAKLFSEKTLKYVIDTYCYDEGCGILENSIRMLYNNALEDELDILKTGYSQGKIDIILEKERLLSSDEASIHIFKNQFFDETSVKKINKIVLDASKEDSTGTADIAREQMRLIANFVRPVTTPDFNYAEFMKSLEKTHTGMENVKLTLARAFAKHSRTGKGNNILMVSEPGQGKTTLIRAAAEAYGIPFIKISCNGVSDSTVFKGTSSNYKGAKPGVIIGGLAEEIGNMAVVLLDEIDKINVSGNSYSVVSSLLDALDEKKFSDSFFGISFDLSHVLFIATANYLENIPPELVDRFEVIEMEAYTPDKKKEILKHNSLKQIYDENQTNGIDFLDEAIDTIIYMDSGSGGMRNAISMCKKVVETVLLTESKHTVTPEDVRNILGESKSVKRIGF